MGAMARDRLWTSTAVAFIHLEKVRYTGVADDMVAAVKSGVARMHATQVLGELGKATDGVVEALGLALDDEHSRWAAADALQNLGPSAHAAANALILALLDGRPFNRKTSGEWRSHVASALKSVDPTGAASKLAAPKLAAVVSRG